MFQYVLAYQISIALGGEIFLKFFESGMSQWEQEQAQESMDNYISSLYSVEMVWPEWERHPHMGNFWMVNKTFAGPAVCDFMVSISRYVAIEFMQWHYEEFIGGGIPDPEDWDDIQAEAEQFTNGTFEIEYKIIDQGGIEDQEVHYTWLTNL